MLWSASGARTTCSLASVRGSCTIASKRSSCCSCVGGLLARRSSGAFSGAALLISKAFLMGPPSILNPKS